MSRIIPQNYMNWRSAKIALIGLAVFLATLIGITALVDVTSSDTSAPLAPLMHIVTLGSMMFIGAGAIVISFVLSKLFFRNTIGKISGDGVDYGWSNMSKVERSRWAIGVVIALSCALIVSADASSLPVSQKGIDLIVYHEVGGKTYFNKYLTRPTVPAHTTTQSGVTIGFGYDCGYNTREEISRDWSDILPENQVRMLQSISGLHGVQAYYANKKIKYSIKVSYAQAESVFVQRSLPRFSSITARSFDLEEDTLSPDCNAALVSVVFNRGGSLGPEDAVATSYDRRMEMRWIKYNIHHNKQNQVSGNIRHMKRLWSKSKLRGLHIRRDAEARLFESGLKNGLN